MVEGDCFNVFLDSGAYLALVAPAFDTKLFGNNGLKKSVDLFETSFIFLRDLRREGLIGGADSLESEDTDGY